MATYIEELSPQLKLFSGYDAQPIDRFNVAPSTRVQLLHSQEDSLHIDAVHWGWAPFWAQGMVTRVAKLLSDSGYGEEARESGPVIKLLALKTAP